MLVRASLGALSLGLGAAQVLAQPTVDTIASTIQQVEGYYPGSLAYRNNNPGNLVCANQTGMVACNNGFAVFGSYDDGLTALDNQIQLYAGRGLTIDQMMAIYAPAGQGSNNPSAYAQTIASSLGVPSSTALTDIGLPPDTQDYSAASSVPVDSGFSGTELAIGAGVLALLAAVVFR